MASIGGDNFGTYAAMPNLGNSSVKVENDLVDFLSKCTMATIPDSSNNHVKSDNNTLCLASSSLDCIPPSVLQMKVLTSLVLDHNDIDVIPDELCQALPHLQKFSIIGNELHTLPEKINCWSQLVELHLTENALVNLPPSICKLGCLKVLKLIGNKLKRLPDELDHLVSLQELYLSENRLCKLPESLSLLESLTVLEINDNKLRALPEEIGRLRRLRLLNLNANHIDELPESMADLETLEELDVSNNNITLFPPELKCAHLLRKLYADCNQICDIPAWFSKLKNLEELSLPDNRLQHCPFSEEFGLVCERLCKFDLGGNFMSCLCDTFGNLKNLQYIHIGSVIGELERRNFQNGNWLSHLPSTFGQLINLREARLDENQLVELPSNFGDLVHLEILDLGQNLLQTLPDSFARLHSLRTCQLSKNKLLRLPENFGNLTNLEDLRLDNNELADMPDLSSLQNLKVLDMFNNNLTKVPTGLASLTKLYILDLDENDLGLSTVDIPHIAFKSTYAPRNPALKDNWRGRERQDLINLQNAELDASVNGTDDARQLATKTLQNALEQGSALWQKHGETGKREKFVRMEQKVPPSHVTNGTEEDSDEKEENWDDEISELDEDCSTSLTDDADYDLNTQTAVDNSVVREQPADPGVEEDWDKELKELYPCPYEDDEPITYHPVPDLMNMHAFISEDGFCPSDMHAKPMRKYYRENTYYMGQFEDAD